MRNPIEIDEKYEKALQGLNRRIGARNSVIKSREENVQKNNDIDKLLDMYEKTSLFLQHVSEISRKVVIQQIETLVTSALQQVLQIDTLQFQINFSVKRNVIDVDFRLFDQSLQTSYSVLDSFGGTVADIISTVLRIILLELYSPKIQGPIILDEVGKWISADYQENFGSFLKQISEKLNRQILMVSHQEKTIGKASKIYKLIKENNASKLEGILYNINEEE